MELQKEGLERTIQDHGRALTVDELITGLVGRQELRALLTQDIREGGGQGCFFECAPMSPGRGEEVFRYVVLPSAAVAGLRPDPSPFRGKLGAPVNRFRNLSGGSWLIAPSPRAATDSANLSRFLQTAPESVIDALWVEAGLALADWLERRRRKVWLSTSGLGVSWLHLRLDSRPKYITHQPYRES